MPRIPPKPSRPPHPTPIERLWSLRKAGRQIDCELHSNGRRGWACRLFDEDWMIYGRAYPGRVDALADAEQQRERLLRDGWTAAG
jgi:hypothetical protein